MSDFKVKMHQIRFRLGLRPRPRWWSLQRSPRPSSWIWGGLVVKGGRGRGGVEDRRGEGPPGTCLHPWYEILNKTLITRRPRNWHGIEKFNSGVILIFELSVGNGVSVSCLIIPPNSKFLWSCILEWWTWSLRTNSSVIMRYKASCMKMAIKR